MVKSKPDVYQYECGRCKHKMSRQINYIGPTMFEMTEGINHIRSRVFLVPGILVLLDTKNIQVLCWVFWHLIFLYFSCKILAWKKI